MSDDEEDFRPSFGVGGLGFRAPGPVDEPDDEPDDEPQRPSFGGGMRFQPPTAFTQSAEPASEHEDAPPAKRMRFSGLTGAANGASSPGPRSASNKSGGGGGGGSSSFAARMMAKMGYKEGEGLGADGRGRLNPIDAQVRPQGIGLGGVREKTKQAKDEEKREAAFRGEVLEDSSEEERKRKKEARKKRQEKGLHGAGTASRRPKTKYRTAAEIEVESTGLEVPNVLKTIIDVTGKEIQFTPSGAGVMVPQETEAIKIARRARRDLEAFAEEWNTLKEQKTYFELENEQIVADIDRHAEETKGMQGLVERVQTLQAISPEAGANDAGDDQWEEITKQLESLELEYKNSFQKLGLHEIAVASATSFFKLAMLNWEPLSDPLYRLEYVVRLQRAFGQESSRGDEDTVIVNGQEYAQLPRKRKSTTLYETMLYSLWLPPVRTAITNDWDVERPEPLEALIQNWRPILPDFILTHVMSQLVIPRLASALAAWKPSQSKGLTRSKTTSPPHHWLFPWLEYLPSSHVDPESHSGLAVELKRKVRGLLSSHDISAGSPEWLIPLQSPMLPRKVFSRLTTNYLLPRLASYIDVSLVINPLNQEVQPLQQVLSYNSIFKVDAFAELMIEGFFAKFHAVLRAWLVAGPDYSELVQWLGWWEHQIPPGLWQSPRIRTFWTAGLEMLNVALELGDLVTSDLPAIEHFLPKTKETGARNEHRKHRRSHRDHGHSHRQSPMKASQERKQDVAITFMDVLEGLCTEHGLLLLPLREAHPTNGAPLLRLTANASGKGGLVGYVQGDILYARSKGQVSGDAANQPMWKPVDLQRDLTRLAAG